MNQLNFARAWIALLLCTLLGIGGAVGCSSTPEPLPAEAFALIEEQLSEAVEQHAAGELDDEGLVGALAQSAAVAFAFSGDISADALQPVVLVFLTAYLEAQSSP